jgi:ribosomal protein S18 acetylase RimI-like enzyme
MLQSREYESAFPRLSGSSCSNRAEDAMASIYKASYVSLHVRKSNRAALSLYRDSLGFTVQGIEKKYCMSTKSF